MTQYKTKIFYLAVKDNFLILFRILYIKKDIKIRLKLR